MRKLARTDAAILTDYGSSKGSFGLRQLLARQLAEEGISASSEQVLLTASGTQAIDLICRMLLRPGDTVVVDDPCYFNFQALLKAHQVKVVAVNYTTTGPDIDAFEHAVNSTTPRMYITNSALHNPTGGTLSTQTAHRILKCATANNITIVEDNIFSGFEPTLSARYAALDGLQNVIRIGSFSKTLSASVRCGYIVANPDWLEVLVDLQVATNFGGPSPVAAELLFLALSDGSFRKHMDALRVRLAKARRLTTTKLERLGVQPWLAPRGGFYLWCSLPNHRDSADVARAALSEQIVLAPGNVFSPSQSKANFMRFNVSQMREPRIFDVLEKLLKSPA